MKSMWKLVSSSFSKSIGFNLNEASLTEAKWEDRVFKASSISSTSVVFSCSTDSSFFFDSSVSIFFDLGTNFGTWTESTTFLIWSKFLCLEILNTSAYKEANETTNAWWTGSFQSKWIVRGGLLGDDQKSVPLSSVA